MPGPNTNGFASQWNIGLNVCYGFSVVSLKPMCLNKSLIFLYYLCPKFLFKVSKENDLCNHVAKGGK